MEKAKYTAVTLDQLLTTVKLDQAISGQPRVIAAIEQGITKKIVAVLDRKGTPYFVLEN